MERLTEKQEKLFNAIKEYIKEHDYSPSIRDLCKMVNVKSSATVFVSLKILKRKGYIDYEEMARRTIKVLV